VAAGLQISSTRGPAVTSLNRLHAVIHQYRTAPIAEVVSVLAAVEVFKVPGSNFTRTQHLIFFLHAVRFS